MIAAKVLPTWRLARTADGLILTLPEGAHLGAVRFRENQRPLVSAKSLFGTGEAIERLVTAEGELAAFQIQRGEDGVRCLGAVFGDDSYTLIEARTTVADRFAFFEQATRAFAFHLSLGLGYRRRRRFEYTSPAGWGGVPRGLDAVWVPPGYPGVRAMLTVHAAQPAGATASDLRDAIIKRHELAGLASIKVGDSERRDTGGELRGLAWRATGSDEGSTTHVDIVVLEDERFLYPIELVASAAHVGEARAYFDYLVHTARAIPTPTVGAP